MAKLICSEMSLFHSLFCLTTQITTACKPYLLCYNESSDCKYVHTHTHTADALRTEGSLLSHHCSDHPFIPTLHREIRKPVSTARLSFSVQRHRRLRAAARPLNAALKHVLLLDTGTVNRAKTRCIVCACR